MNTQFWKGTLIFQLVMLLALAATIPFNDPGTPTYVITQIAAIHIFIGIALVSLLIWTDWDPFASLR